MQYRTLGNAGLAVSELALGTMYFGSENTEDEAFALLDAFTEDGGTLLDTSDVYSGAPQVALSWIADRPGVGVQV
ncbi:aldo/keto reductase [Streptomyces hyaluromycini]|uniref:Aldo/keto reductase n=1 Tax=Streptomyces hyaluromycini TaxID=1377993 RepID=A0ABV1X2Y0_9ACTN